MRMIGGYNMKVSKIKTKQQFNYLIDMIFRTKNYTKLFDDRTVVIKFKDNETALQFVNVWKEKHNPIHANIYKTEKKIGTDEKNNAQNDEGI